MSEVFRHSKFHTSLQCVNRHYANKRIFIIVLVWGKSRRLRREAVRLDFLHFMVSLFGIIFFFSFSWILCLFCRRTLPANTGLCFVGLPFASIVAYISIAEYFLFSTVFIFHFLNSHQITNGLTLGGGRGQSMGEKYISFTMNSFLMWAWQISALSWNRIMKNLVIYVDDCSNV